MSANLLGEEKRSRQIGGHEAVPFLARDIDRLAAKIGAGIVHQDVNLAELFDGFDDRAFDAFLLAQIQFDANRPAAGARDVSQHHIEILGSRRSEREREAVARERNGRGGAHAIGSAGDERDPLVWITTLRHVRFSCSYYLARGLIALRTATH